MNTNLKKTILISYKADFRVRKIISDKVGHNIMIKWFILQEYIKVLTTVSKCRTQKLITLQGETDKSIIIV